MAANKRFEKRTFQGKKYGLRQNQLFGPWGVGAILPCPDDSSVMIAGLDAFPYQEMETVNDRRLASYIGVRKLLSPPLGDNCTVPAVRFPRWLYCPACGTMYRTKTTQQVSLFCENPECNKKIKHKARLIPDRFIVVCPEGHIDELPIVEWVHGKPVTNPDAHTIVRKTKGGSASLGDIVYECKTCGIGKSLFGISQPGALEKCGYHCSGSSPWLDLPTTQCSSAQPPMVVQRGGTNVWYSDVVSSIYIPEKTSKGLRDFVENNFESLSMAFQANEAMLGMMAETLAKQCSFSAGDIKAAFLDAQVKPTEDEETEGGYKEQEFKTLLAAKASSQEKGSFEGKLVTPLSYSSILMRSLIDSITLVNTLKETKALVGFTRLFPDSNDDKSFHERRKVLSRKQIDWTLGIQQTGEGIFMSFDKSKLDEWAETPELKLRLAMMQANLDRDNADRSRPKRKLNPRFVLIHTLSHVLMLSLAKECGYTAASIKERIYCDRYSDQDDAHENMLGLLIYTASDDSEGSLGGLVRAGRPGRFEHIFDKALYDACWCSCDPVCIESPGQGQNSCNLAACYSCALVPETSCECGNKLLDRGMIVGTMSSPSIGIVGKKLRKLSIRE